MVNVPEIRNSKTVPIVVLGAGPAGLGAAYKLAERKCFGVTVLERNPEVGGNAGSFELEGLRVDFGSHRLHPSCSEPVMADIRSMLGGELLDRPRHGRIRLRRRWVHFPLHAIDLISHLPLSFITGIAGDSIVKICTRGNPAYTFEAVLERGLGKTICRDFYFPYARKIWGVDPGELDAEQARRRVSAGSLSKMIRKTLSAVPGFKPKHAGRFFYPRRGFGSISEAYHAAAVQAGADIALGTPVCRVQVQKNRITTVYGQTAEGCQPFPARQVLSTLPISALVRVLDPAAPAEIMRAAKVLRTRAMVLIYLVLETERFTDYDAHYFPEIDIPITRLSEPKNYGLASCPGKTALCAELPCSTEDPIWTASDEELGDLLVRALAAVDLPVKARVSRVVVRRLPNAYPIYTRNYREHFDLIDSWLNGIDGLLTFGRQGLFAHDNTHHTLAMAYAVNACLDQKGELDRQKWGEYRREFQHHVVED